MMQIYPLCTKPLLCKVVKVSMTLAVDYVDYDTVKSHKEARERIVTFNEQPID